ncbi:NADH dehydrogenase [ubiquinone] 1 alpha subcomplex subunit 11 [Mantella aurantiaca]
MGYWDNPDGTKCGEKTWLTTKIATGLGIMSSSYSIILFPPKTALEGLKRAGNVTFTMAALGAIFGMTTCIAAQVREKPDDATNYFIGGCTSGIFLGIKSHSYATASAACLSLGAIATFIKVSKKEGWVLIPSEPKL